MLGFLSNIMLWFFYRNSLSWYKLGISELAENGFDADKLFLYFYEGIKG
jgi:hypothetical protein